MRAALLVVGFCAFCAGVRFYARWAHDLRCEGDRTGRCGWAWCRHYDGSDYLHDFNF